MKWIKISEQLPPFDDRVLFCHYDNSIDVGYLDSTEEGYCYIADAGHMPLCIYDYWMPLPELPK